MKRRYSIEDVVRMLAVCRKTYYNWEASGKVPKPKRDPMSKFRYWTEEDVKKLKKITGR